MDNYLIIITKQLLITALIPLPFPREEFKRIETAFIFVSEYRRKCTEVESVRKLLSGFSRRYGIFYRCSIQIFFEVVILFLRPHAIK